MTALPIHAEPPRPTLTLVPDRSLTDAPAAPVRVSGRCVRCDGLYINDLAWRRADDEQLDAWTVHGIGPHAGNGLCAGCASPDPDHTAVEAVIEQLVVEVSEQVAAHLAGHDSELAKSNHVLDIGGDANLDIWDVIAQTYGAPPGDWQEGRSCEGRDDLIFAEKKAQLDEAKSTLCGPCPVRSACLNYALRQPDSAFAGVWGGLHQKGLKETRWSIKREGYRRNGMSIGRFGNPVPMEV